MAETLFNNISHYLTGNEIAVLLSTTVILGAAWTYRRRQIKAQNSTLSGKAPPEPPGIWFFGNALQLPDKEDWLLYDKWHDEYGTSCLHIPPSFYFTLQQHPIT